MPSSLSHAHANIQTHMPPSVPVGEGYYLMESCFIYFFFFSRSYRPFHRHPACPARKTMRAQSLLLGRAPSIFHLRPPTHPQKKQPTLHSHLPNVISTLSHFHPPPPLVLTPACPPRFWQRVHDGRLFFSRNFFSAVKMCSRLL